MMNNKTTKRALLSSVMALIICFAMLLGTTYAWFTDSVTSANNIIQSGSLKIDLIHEGTSIKNTPNYKIFDYAKWEPGYTQVETLTIVNQGTLALKYVLTLDAAGADIATTGEKLSDVIDVYVCEDVSTAQSAADLASDAWNKLGTLTDVLAKDAVVSGSLLPKGAEKNSEDDVVEQRTFTIALHMQESAGNVYQDLSLGNISVKLLATQYTYEEDAFGPDYDADLIPGATYVYDADGAYAAFNSFDQSGKSGVVILAADYKTADAQNHWSSNREYALRAAGTDVTFDLNGQKVSNNRTYQNGNNTGYTYLFTTAYNGKLTVNGNEGSITSENADGFTCIFYAQGPSEVVINGGDYHAVRGVPVWAGNGATVTINGGSFTSSGAEQELIYSSGGVINIYDGFFHNTGWENRPVNVANANRGTGFINIYGGTFVNFDPSTGGDDPGNIRVMEGYKVISETQENGDIWYTVVPVPEGM